MLQNSLDWHISPVIKSAPLCDATRYSCRMIRFLLPTVLWTCAASAVAQPAPAAVLGNGASSTRDLRRAELRMALQASRRSDLLPVRAEAPQKPDRHLTESERTEMRHQLRQQQGEGAKVRP